MNEEKTMADKSIALTKAYKAGNKTIGIVQVGNEFKIVKKVINYIRGKNVESWRVMGSASTFDNLESCVKKFSAIVNEARKAEGKPEINFITE